MCKPASFVLTKDKVFWSKKTDSHDEIIREFGLHEGNAVQIYTLKVEISPADGDIFSDPATWPYKLDQDMLPAWHNPVRDKKRAEAALRDWVAARVFIGKAGLVFNSDEVVFLKNSSAELWGSSSAELWGSSSVELWDSSSAVLRGSSSAVLRDSSSAELYDSSSAVLWDSSSAESIKDSATATNKSSEIDLPKPAGKYAVAIDRRGDRAICTVGE